MMPVSIAGDLSIGHAGFTPSPITPIGAAAARVLVLNVPPHVVGDLIGIKAFEGSSFDEQPSLPLLNYNIKGKIVASAENDFTTFFNAIEIGIRGISIGIFATVKLVDEMIKVIQQLAQRVQSTLNNIKIPKQLYLALLKAPVTPAAKAKGAKITYFPAPSLTSSAA